MADDIKVKITFEGDKSSIDRTLKGVVSSAEKEGKKAGDSFSDGFTSGLGSIAKVAAGAAAVIGTVFAGIAGKAAFDAAASIEQIKTRFEVLSGSAAAAEKQIKDLVDFAARTPFQLEGLADASAKLQAFGFEQNTIIDRLGVLGDLAAGSGANIQELALIFGQISAAGKLTGERLLQLEERGIVIGPALAKSFGIAESQVRSFVSAGKIGLADVEEAFRSLTGEGGKFFEATQKQSKTLGGLVSTLKDNFFALQVAIGQALGPLFKQSVDTAISVVRSLTETVTANSASILKGFIAFSRGINEFVVAPIELAVNLAQNSFTAVAAGIDVVVGKIKTSIGSIGSLLENIGAGGSFSNSLTKLGEEGAVQLETAFEEFNAIKDRTFDFSSALKVEEFLSNLELIAAESEAPLDTLAQNFEKTNKKIVASTAKTSKQLAGLINQAIVQTTSRGIQALTQSLVLGQKGFENFGKQIFSILGDLSIKLGESLILTGVGIESLKALSGAAAIAAGAGLIALGTILKSVGGGPGLAGAPAGAGAGGFEGSSGGGVGSEGGVAVDQQEEREAPSTAVNLTVNGDVFDSDETSLRIASLLNNAFENEGVTIRA